DDEVLCSTSAWQKFASNASDLVAKRRSILPQRLIRARPRKWKAAVENIPGTASRPRTGRAVRSIRERPTTECDFAGDCLNSATRHRAPVTKRKRTAISRRRLLSHCRSETQAPQERSQGRLSPWLRATARR